MGGAGVRLLKKTTVTIQNKEGSQGPTGAGLSSSPPGSTSSPTVGVQFSWELTCVLDRGRIQLVITLLNFSPFCSEQKKRKEAEERLEFLFKESGNQESRV